MIVCTNCGFHNEDDDSFCGGCQEYLDWTGTTTEVDEPEVVTDDADDEDKGLVERVLDRFGGDDEAEGTAVGGAAAVDGGADAGTATGVDVASITNDTVARVEAEAAEATRREQTARDDVEDRHDAAEQARRAAEEAEQAQAEATERAAAEAERLERLRAELANAEQAPAADESVAEELPADASVAATDEAAPGPDAEPSDDESGADAEPSDAEPGADAEASDAEASDAEASDEPASEVEPSDDEPGAGTEPPAAEPEDDEDLAGLRAELEAAEEQARRAEEQARADEEAAEQARKAAAEAAEAEREAARRAEEEAREAQRARRAAALVARPAVASPATRPDDGGASPETAGPGPSRPVTGRRTRRTRKRRAQADTPAPAEPVDTPSGPGAVRPEQTKARRVAPAKREAPTRKLRPGDLVCGNCGEGNNPERNFCRRCGDDLTDTEVVKVAWWKRPFVRTPKAAPAAGTRPGRGRDAGKSARGAKRGVLGAIGKVGRVVAMVAIIGGALGVAVIPTLRDTVMERASSAYTSVRRLVAPEYEPVTPTNATSSPHQPDHPPGHTIDNLSNTWWSGLARPDRPARLDIAFGEPVDLAIFGITPGAADPDLFAAQPRPRRLHVVFDTGTTMDVELVDEHVFQTFPIENGEQISHARIDVLEVWPGQSDSGDVAITTIEFRTAK